MGVVRMSDLPGVQQEFKAKKNKMITMNQIVDVGSREQSKLMVKNNRKVWEVLRQGMWKGQRCFIVGGGKSVKQFNLKAIQGEHTIGVNMAFRLFEPEIIYAMDARLWGWIENNQAAAGDMEAFAKTRAIKIWSDITAAPLPEDIVIAPSIKRPGISADLKDGVACGTNSGFGALNLALLLGASEIYLMGYDFEGDRWHRGYPQGGDVSHDYHLQVYEENETEFKELFPDQKIINLNPKSKLKIFEFGEMPKDVKAERPKDAEPGELKPVERKVGKNEPVFVNYYTVDNGYEKYARNLEKTLKYNRLEYDIQAVKDKGDWDSNTRFKPEFVLRMFERYPDRDLVWLDADSVVVSVPIKLLNCKADVAGHYREGKEFISSVMFFKNCPKTKSFLQEVCDLLKSGEKREFGEQKFFQEVLDAWKEKKGFKFEDLGPEYCYIMGLKNPDVDPVIEQHQASRTLKR